LNSIVRSQLWKKQTFTNYIIGTTKGWATPIEESTIREEPNDIMNSMVDTPIKEDILKHDCFLRMVYIDCMLDDVDLWCVPDDKVSKGNTNYDGLDVKGVTLDGGGMKNINQRGGMKANIFRIVQIATCAFLWGVISNNYYERLQTFGPQISILIKENYQDVLTSTQIGFGEMKELKNVLEDFELIVNADEDTDLPLPDSNEKIKKMNEKHLEFKQLEGKFEISYGTIAEYIGVSYYHVTSGPNNMDLINYIESRVTEAVTKDVTNIIAERIGKKKAMVDKAQHSALTTLGDTVTDFITGFFYSSSLNYKTAPGASDNVLSKIDRGRLTKKIWTRWQESFGDATYNFVNDVLLHIRTTSYYLWAYFIGMQALEVVAVRAFYKLLVSRNGVEGDSDDGSDDGSCDDSGGAGETKRCLTTLDSRVDILEQSFCRKTGAPLPSVSGIKYLLIVALFRGLAETMRIATSGTNHMDLKTTITYLETTDLNPNKESMSSESCTSSALQSFVWTVADCRNSNEGSQKQPSLKKSSKKEGPPKIDRQLSTSEKVPNIHHFRTSNGITINLPAEEEEERFDSLIEASKNFKESRVEFNNRTTGDDVDEGDKVKDGDAHKNGGRKTRKRRKKSKRKKSKRKTRKNNLYKMKGGDNENKIKSPEDTFETNLNEFNGVVNRLYLEEINKNMLLQQQEQKKQMLREISKINLNIKEGTNREADLKKQMLQNHQELKERVNILAKSITNTSQHDKNAKKKRKSRKHNKQHNKQQKNLKRRRRKTRKKKRDSNV